MSNVFGYGSTDESDPRQIGLANQGSSLLDQISLLGAEERAESELIHNMEEEKKKPKKVRLPDSPTKQLADGEDAPDEAWNAHSHALCCNATATVNVQETLEVFNMIDKDRNGNVSVEELLEAGKSPYVQRLLRSTNNFVLTSLIRSMEDREQFMKIFKELDPNGDKQISEEEWCEFVKSVAHERICYLKKIGLTSGRCFWGRGRKADFLYSLYNSHPLLQFFYRDPDYPATTAQLVAKELIVLSATLFLSVSAAEAMGVDARCNGQSVAYAELAHEW